MENLKLKKTILEVVDNQLNANDPPCTSEAYQRLQDAGYSKQEAKEKLGAVVQEQIYNALKDGEPFDEESFEQAMNEMVEQCIDFEDDYSLPSEWDAVTDMIDAGDMALMEEEYPEVVELWMEAWELCKEIVAKLPRKMTIYELEEESDYSIVLDGWLAEMEMELGNAGEQEKRLRFCHEVLDTFDWIEGDGGEFRAAIGEALYNLGRKEEGWAWFEEWMRRTPHDVNIVNEYSWCLRADGKTQEAYELLKKELQGKPCTIENDFLFLRMYEIMESLGYQEEAEGYKKKYEGFQEELEGMEDEDVLFDAFWKTSHKPIVKPEKIYPNDPCPCGSGKKYKKCCGKG